MSPFGYITCTWRAEVHVPKNVYRFLGAKKYEQFAQRAANGLGSGSHEGDGDVIVEWAVGPTEQACERFINMWHNYILDCQAQLRLKEK